MAFNVPSINVLRCADIELEKNVVIIQVKIIDAVNMVIKNEIKSLECSV
jgi:hypothetical protein